MSVPCVQCANCGASADRVRISVDVHNGDIHCDGCDEMYGADAAPNWGAVLAWLRLHPAARPDAPKPPAWEFSEVALR